MTHSVICLVLCCGLRDRVLVVTMALRTGLIEMVALIVTMETMIGLNKADSVMVTVITSRSVIFLTTSGVIYAT